MDEVAWELEVESPSWGQLALEELGEEWLGLEQQLQLLEEEEEGVVVEEEQLQLGREFQLEQLQAWL